MDRGRDRLFLWLLLAQLPLAIVVDVFLGSSPVLHALGEGAPLAALAVVAYWQLAGTRAFRTVGAALLMLFSGLQIHLSDGAIELHFGVFVGMALLIVFFDWLPITVAAATIILHHAVIYSIAPH